MRMPFKNKNTNILFLALILLKNFLKISQADFLYKKNNLKLKSLITFYLEVVFFFFLENSLLFYVSVFLASL